MGHLHARALRIGAAVACTEQLRANDLRWRLEVTRPAIVLADERNRDELMAARPECPVVWLPDGDLLSRNAPLPAADVDPGAPAVLTFTSGTTGKPKAVVHIQRYLWGQELQAQHWLGPRPGELV
jgi:acetyl-CoA synthetase